MGEKVLVIVDMQKDFTTGVLGNAACVKAIDEVVDIVNHNQFDRIFFTRDTHQKNYMETQEGRKLPVEHCIEGSDGWQVVDAIQKAVDAKNVPVEYFDKPTFGSVKLGDRCRELYQDGEGTEVYFCGVCTGICVINNVAMAKANCPEAVVRVFEKGCACVTPETHKTAIEAMKTFQVEIV